MTNVGLISRNSVELPSGEMVREGLRGGLRGGLRVRFPWREGGALIQVSPLLRQRVHAEAPSSLSHRTFSCLHRQHADGGMISERRQSFSASLDLDGRSSQLADGTDFSGRLQGVVPVARPCSDRCRFRRRGFISFRARLNLDAERRPSARGGPTPSARSQPWLVLQVLAHQLLQRDRGTAEANVPLVYQTIHMMISRPRRS